MVLSTFKWDFCILAAKTECWRSGTNALRTCGMRSISTRPNFYRSAKKKQHLAYWPNFLNETDLKCRKQCVSKTSFYIEGAPQKSGQVPFSLVLSAIVGWNWCIWVKNTFLIIVWQDCAFRSYLQNFGLRWSTILIIGFI